MRSCYAGPSYVVQQGEGITAGSYDVTAMMPGQEGTPYYNMRRSGTRECEVQRSASALV